MESLFIKELLCINKEDDDAKNNLMLLNIVGYSPYVTSTVLAIEKKLFPCRIYIVDGDE